MLEFFKILGLTVLGIIALLSGGFLICWLMLWIWPIVVLALPIALIIYIFNRKTTKEKPKDVK